MTADPFEHDDAAYVLGTLDEPDRAAFEAHLTTCAACRARVDELRPTAALLAGAGPFAGLENTAPDGIPLPETSLPETLLPGLLRRAARERTRRRVLAGAVAGFAAACLVALVVTLWPGTSTPRPRQQALTALRTTNIRATAALIDRPWGTQIDLHCKYETGKYAPTPTIPYVLTVIDTAGKPHDAGDWRLVPGRTIDYVGGTSVRRERIHAVRVTLPDGTAILELRL